ncbi:MAG: Xaa-Pro peptidase family protein [Ornithinimicrobium sp.]
MVGKIAASMKASASQERAAGQELHHITLGPGPDVEAEWLAAGLVLPNVDAIRTYRIGRVRRQLIAMGYDGAILRDPMNVRYATDSTNMQVWVMHNPARYAWVGADGSVIVWEFANCEFLSGHNAIIDEVRPAISSFFFLAGPLYRQRAQAWTDEILSVIRAHAGIRPRIAVDTARPIEVQMLIAADIELGDGTEMMEMARSIKSDDEIRAMRCSIAACETTMGEMREAMTPGMTERHLWSLLHAGNIRRGGEWIETQILSSGPRTNPWMQEASSRVIQNGDMVGYDTDLVGSYGMMCDISRTWVAGDAKPTATQRGLHALAQEQIERNHQLLIPGGSFREICEATWMPPVDEYRHYSVSCHGVGQCDEYPEIVLPNQWESVGYDGVLEVGMVLTTEAYVGSRYGGEGVKLEEQYLVTETGPKRLSNYPIDLR